MTTYYIFTYNFREQAGIAHCIILAAIRLSVKSIESITKSPVYQTRGAHGTSLIHHDDAYADADGYMYETLFECQLVMVQGKE